MQFSICTENKPLSYLSTMTNSTGIDVWVQTEAGNTEYHKTAMLQECEFSHHHDKKFVLIYGILKNKFIRKSNQFIGRVLQICGVDCSFITSKKY